MRKLVVALVASCARGSTYSFPSVREARLRVITCIGLTYILVFIQKSHSVVFCSSALPLSNSGSLCLVCKAQEESRTDTLPHAVVGKKECDNIQLEDRPIAPPHFWIVTKTRLCACILAFWHLLSMTSHEFAGLSHLCLVRIHNTVNA